MRFAMPARPWALLLTGALTLALVFSGTRVASAYEAPNPAFSGGQSAMTGSGLTQTWEVTGATTLTGTATTAGAKGFTTSIYSPSLTTTTPAQTVTTAVSTCSAGVDCTGLGTLKVTFAHPVVNPIIHFAGLGGSVGRVLFHATLTLTTPGLTMTKQGTGTNFTLNGSTVDATDQKLGTQCTTFAAPATSPAICGSFRLNGTVTTATFDVGARSIDTSTGGTLSAGADEYLVLATADQDYGDAPTSYDAGDAARALVSDIRLGSTVSAENTATLNATTDPNAGASATGDSDDGAAPQSLTNLSTSYSTTVTLSGASAPGEVCGWVDVNRNSVFDTGERACQAVVAGQTSAVLTWSGLTGVSAGATYARFRVGYNTAQTMSPTGASDSGEVEDYPVTITAVAVPVAAPDAATTLQDVTVTINPLTNDSADSSTTLDPASVRLYDPATSTYVTSLTVAGEGTYTVDTTTGAVTFDPLPAFTGNATPVTYRVADTYGQTATSTIAPHVTPVTPAPVNDTASTPFNTATSVNVLANDAAGEASSPLVPASVKLLDPATGTYGSSVTIAGEGTYVVDAVTGAVAFTPTAGFRGTATPVTYRVADDNGTTATATLTVTVGAPPSPTASDDSAVTPQGVPVTLPTLANDALSPLSAALVPGSVRLQDPADSAFKTTVTITGQGTWTVNTSTGEVSFAPLATFTGSATPLTYRVADVNGATSQAIERVSVSPVVPTANADSTTTPYETPVTVTVVANDTPGDPAVALVPSSVQLRDPSDSTWKSSVTLPGVGTWSVQPSGAVLFVPVQGYTGTSSLPYRVADVNGSSAESTVSVTVSNPSAPVASPDAATTDQGVPVTVVALTNDTSDPAAPLQPATVRLLDGATPVTTLTVPGEGTYTVQPDGSVAFAPVPTFHGAATSVSYQVADEAGQLATATISVQVTAVTPTALPDAATTPYEHAVTFALLGNDSAGALSAPLVVSSVAFLDPSDSAWKTSVTLPGVGTFVANLDGTTTFTPAAGFTGTTADLPYRVTDSNGTYASSTVHVTVGAAPTANQDSGSTPQGVPTTVDTLTNDVPGTGATLVPASVKLLDPSTGTYKTSVTIPGEGTYTVDPTDGAVTFTPLPAYHGSATPIGYEVSDSDDNTSTSTIALVVNEVTPVAQPDTTTTPYETAVIVALLDNDNAGDASVPLVPSSVQLLDPATGLYASSVTLPGVGTFVVQPGGAAGFTPVQGFTGTTPALTYMVDDANGTIATSTVAVTVSNPAAPTAAPDTASTSQGIAVSLHPLSNDTSDPAAPLAPASLRILDPSTGTYAASVTVAGEGTYTVDGATGDVLFTPVLSFHGTGTQLTYRVADEAGQFATSTLQVTVDAITPTAGADSATTPYVHAVTVPLLANDAEGAATAPLVPGSVQLQDPADSAWKTSVTVPGMGTYEVQPDGSVTFTPQAGYSGVTPALPYRVADANGTYASSTVTITVGAPPTASPDTNTTPQGLPVLTDVITNDTPGTGATIVGSSLLLEDPANPGVWAVMVDVPGEGTYLVDPMGRVAFLPVPTFQGTATSIRYRTLDSNGNAAISSLTITVTPVTPVAHADAATTPYETTVDVPLLGNDVPGDPGVALSAGTVQLKDPSDGTWTSSLTVPGTGTYVVQTDGSVSFTPAQGYTGTTPAVTYHVADANGTLTESTVTVTVDEPAAPAAADDATTTLQGTPVTLSTLVNDTSDPAAPLAPASVRLLDQSSGTYGSSVTIPGEGTYAVDASTGDVTFTPVKAFHGAATPITYEVADEAGQTTTAAIKVTVTAVTPTATPNSATTPFAHSVMVPVVSDDSPGDPSIPLVPSTLTLRDPSDGTWKAIVVVAGVGTYTANPDGSVAFVPTATYAGTATALPYRVADANGTYAQSLVTITVSPAPSAAPDTASALQGQPVTVSPLVNDTAGGTATLDPSSVMLLDPSDGTYKTAVTITGEGTYTVDPTTHDVHFVPVPAFSGTATAVGYMVTDSDGNTATSTITVTIAPVIPVAMADNASTPYAHAVTVPLLANDAAGDPVVPLVPGSVQFQDLATGAWATTVTVAGVGTYAAQSDGSVTFTPANGFTGTTAALPYRVSDSNGTITSSTVSIVVGAAPVAATDAATTLQNQPVTLHTLANDDPGTGATLVPSSVQLIDPVTGALQTVVMVPNQGTYAVDWASGDITFTPVPWFTGAATPIGYQVSDTDANVATSSVSVHVTAVVPNVVSDSGTTPFRTPVTVPVLANDTAGDVTAPLDASSVVIADPADGLWKTTVTVPGQGTFAVQPDGQVLFTPDPGYEGVVNPVTYRVTDANGTMRSASIDIVIGNAPVAAPDAGTTLQGHSVTVPLLANDHPGTGGTLDPSSTLLLDPSDGTYKASVVIDAEGTWTVDPATGVATFAPVPSFVGHSTPIGYKVTDSYGNTATAAATVTVAEVIPTASGDTASTPFRTPVTVAVLDNDSAGRADTPLDTTTVQLLDPATGLWGTTVAVAGVGQWAVQSDGSVAFTPVATYDGTTDPISYRVADINGTYAESTLVVTVDPPFGAAADPDSANSSGTAPVTIQPLLNDTPSHGATWIPSSVCLVPDSAKTIAGTDLSSCPKTATVAGVGTWLVNADGSLTFTPAAGYKGSASIGYVVTDTNGVEVSNTAVVTVTQLASTGGPALFVGVAGFLMLLLGGAVLIIARRRRDDEA